MTLYRRLAVFITLVIAVLMVGNLIVTLMNYRVYVFEQLQTHAQDTATSLGLSLTHAADIQDRAQIEVFINAVYDRGAFQSVSYQGYGDGLKVTKEQSLGVDSVPAWFVSWVRLPSTMGSAEVMSGWQRRGFVTVTSDTRSAYSDLWQLLQQQVGLFLLVALVCYLLAALALYTLLRPLRLLQNQAEAISRREFKQQSPLPKVPELRKVVASMNSLVERLQSNFREQAELSEGLYRDAHLDELTGISNRGDFNSRLQGFLSSDKGGAPALLMLVHIEHLAQLNIQQGRAVTNELLIWIAQQLREHFQHPDVVCARLSGSDFVVFAPFLQRDEAQAAVDAFGKAVAAGHWFDLSTGVAVRMGATYTEAAMLGNSLLPQADMAMGQARAEVAPVAVQWCEEESEDARHGVEWKQLIESTLSHERFSFFVQPIVSSGQSQTVQREILCRLYSDQKLIAASVLLPMAERYHLVARLDRQVLEKVAGANLPQDESVFAMNLSLRSLDDPEFLGWLNHFLRANKQLSARLCLELSENILSSGAERLTALHRMVREHGVTLGLDGFGGSALAFPYLQSLPLSYVKLHGRFTEDIESESTQFYLRSLINMAHSCDLQVYAENVETELEWQQYQRLGVDGGQGFYFGKPQQLGE